MSTHALRTRFSIMRIDVVDKLELRQSAQSTVHIVAEPVAGGLQAIPSRLRRLTIIDEPQEHIAVFT